MTTSNLSVAIVKREKEVNEVMGLWKDVCRGDTKITFREFCGIPGIGKTILLRQIKDALEAEKALCAHLDFDPFQNPGGETPKNERIRLYLDQPEVLFQDLLEGWKYLTPEFKEISTKILNKSPFVPIELAQQLVDVVKSLATEQSVVLLCDESDFVRQKQLLWFEEKIIAPLILSNRCLIVRMDKRKKEWPSKFANLKFRIKSSDLQPFHDNEIIKAIFRSNQEIARDNEGEFESWVYDIAYGHPMAQAVASQIYIQNHEQLELPEIKNKIIVAIETRVIRNHLMRENDLRLDEVYSLSLLRTTDFKLCRAILGSQWSFGRLNVTLKPNPLAGDPRKGWLQKTIAEWLNHYYLITNPVGYLEKQIFLIQECDQFAKECIARKETIPWIEYLNQLFYHFACARKVDKKYEIVAMIKANLQLAKNELNQDYPEALGKLIDRLEADGDLREHFGQDFLDQLFIIMKDEI